MGNRRLSVFVCVSQSPPCMGWSVTAEPQGGGAEGVGPSQTPPSLFHNVGSFEDPFIEETVTNQQQISIVGADLKNKDQPETCQPAVMHSLAKKTSSNRVALRGGDPTGRRPLGLEARGGHLNLTPPLPSPPQSRGGGGKSLPGVPCAPACPSLI